PAPARAARLLAPPAGLVTVSGAPLAGRNAQAGYLFQADALFPWMTALDNVAIALEVAGVAKGEARDRAREWLVRVGLGGFSRRFSHMLFRRQRQRAGGAPGALSRSQIPPLGDSLRA